MRNQLQKYLGNKNLILVFLIALIIRLFFFIISDVSNPEVYNRIIIQPGNDPYTYHIAAINLNQSISQGSLPEPNPLRTPGYSIFVALIYAIFGNNPWVVLLCHIVIDSISAFLLFIIFARFFNNRIGLLVGLFYALDPHLIIFSLSMYSDTLFIFFLILSFYFLSSYLTEASNNKYDLVIFSVLFGLATLIKPVLMYSPLIVILFIFIKYRKILGKALKFSGIFIFIFLLVLSPRLIRNYNSFDRVFLSTAGDYNLLKMGVVPMETEKRDPADGSVLFSLLTEADSLMRDEDNYPFIPQQNYSDSDSGLTVEYSHIKSIYWRKLALIYIKEDPLLFAKHYSLGILHSFFNLGTSIYSEYLGLEKSKDHIDLKGESDLIQLINKFFKTKSVPEIIIGFFILCYLVIIYISLVLGLFRIKKFENKYLLFLCLSFAAYFILVAGTGGLARFKMPAIPFYLIFSAIGIDYLLGIIRKRSFKINS